MSAKLLVSSDADALESTSTRGSLYLHPGKLATSAESIRITTILGSCVAVCLYDDVAHVGGMNHYLLPRWNGSDDGSLRYGNVAIERLIRAVLQNGAALPRLRAKIFGGATVVDQPIEGTRHNIGRQNVEAALQILAAERITIVVDKTGGNRGCKVVFCTEDGSVLVKWL